MSAYHGYEMVIGLEVHVELATASKMFCACSTSFGAPANTQCCPVCMGLPGALPVANRRAVELAVLAGRALGCHVKSYSAWDRKNYFYPDNPKAYQITQYHHPICLGGSLEIDTVQGVKPIGITRIHLEEDAGKLTHDAQNGTLIDFNRCGVPLIEIVSEPDLRSPEEAVSYLKKLRTYLRFAGVSDCLMQQGSMRCDVNLSVRPIGQSALGVRTEIKNLNSFAFVAKAIEYEYRHQVDLLREGKEIYPQTRRFDPDTGKTHLMRRKESCADYGYFAEGDLPPVVMTREQINEIANTLPVLPDVRRARYMSEWGIAQKDAELLSSRRELAEYFESAAATTPYPVIAANLLLSEFLRFVPDETFTCPVAPARLGELATLQGEETVNSATVKKLVKRLFAGDFSPREAVAREGLAQINDEATIGTWVREVLASDPKSVEALRGGKSNALGALVGGVMAKSGGRANPRIVNRLIAEMLQ